MLTIKNNLKGMVSKIDSMNTFVWFSLNMITLLFVINPLLKISL